jgi:hypothetical protein
MATMVRVFALALVLVGLAGCGGGHGGSGTAATTAPTAPTPPVAPALTNFVSVVVDDGPTSVTTGPNAYIQYNVPFVSVTICVPGTSNCQTIDHVQVDTGSEGLRLLRSVVSPSLLAALPTETDTPGNPVGECYQYVEGYGFGSVRQGDFTIGGETVADMPFQLIGDTGQFANAPSSCTSSGGSAIAAPSDIGANGIIGIGTIATDCASYCTLPGGYAAAIYYDCPAAGCGGIITRAASTSAPFQQVPNPVAAMTTDNNGSSLVLPQIAASGQATATGTLFFGIGTQTNNGLGAATVIPATSSNTAGGGGLITVVYNGQTLSQSFIDSGSSDYVFVDPNIALCTNANYKGYYCPASPLTLNLTIGSGATSKAVALTLNNAATLLNTSYAALPGLGLNPKAAGVTNAYPDSFDIALPFFYGRSVYTAIEGRTAGGAAGPYYAF